MIAMTGGSSRVAPRLEPHSFGAVALRASDLIAPILGNSAHNLVIKTSWKLPALADSCTPAPWRAVLESGHVVGFDAATVLCRVDRRRDVCLGPFLAAVEWA